MPAAVQGSPRPDGGFHLVVHGQLGSYYGVQASTNLADWIWLFTNRASFDFLDTDATNYPARFYRTIIVP